MSEMDDIESGVVSTSVEDIDAPAVAVEAPSGATAKVVEPAVIPPASLFNWGRGPFARDSDRGIWLTWRAPTYARQGQKPKRPFAPRAVLTINIWKRPMGKWEHSTRHNSISK